jgi:5-methylcytosine-specific restriction enzyme subunit McrC
VTHLVVREYARLYLGTQARLLDGSPLRAELPPQAFQSLKELLMAPETVELPVLSYGLDQGREVLRLSSWVGVLQTPDGTQIEVLPKLLDDKYDVARTRHLFVRMLAALPEVPPLLWNEADLQAERTPLLEFVAAQFLQGAARLVRQGLARSYREQEQELPALRGRLDLARHLRLQPSRPSTLAVVADEFLIDRPENRAIRTALAKIRPLLRQHENIRLHTQLLAAFADVPLSAAPLHDLHRWQHDRSHRHYTVLRPLVELILRDLAPLTAQGETEVLALLFPMERVFEAYVAQQLRLARGPDGARLYTRVDTQVAGEALVTQERRPLFRLRPDLKLILPGGETVLADTKWKRLDPGMGRQAGLQMADLYQMYAYGQKYLGGRGRIWLIYPRTAQFQQPLPRFHYSGELSLDVRPYDLERNTLL